MSCVYSLSGSLDDRFQLGNKGANLVIMTRLGLPVPSGFVVSIDAYRSWRETGSLPDEAIDEALLSLEKDMKGQLGKAFEVSVRSSAPTSMPGMMDTVLNIGSHSEMMGAVKHIFESWDNLRAVEYRRLNKISPTLGTAAVVQVMVYGNRDEQSATGVVFTRNPNTGENALYGEFLMGAQGEDIVSGVRTPEPVATLKSVMPTMYTELEAFGRKLERHFCDMQDIEFTVESGKLYILQTRSGKRSGRAAVKIALDMMNEGIITQEEAILRVTVDDLNGLLHKQLKKASEHRPLIKGLNASPGAACGRVVFDTAQAIAESKRGIGVILVRPETSPDDIQGVAASVGVLTRSGGLTSHAAVVTRALGKPCICGAEGLAIDMEAREFHVDGHIIREGSEITIDGTSGNVYEGVLALEEAQPAAELKDILSMADGFKRLGVRANADTPAMIAQAKTFGAEGIGLCRTERMFNAPERLSVIREFILAQNAAQRTAAIKRLRDLQARDFVALFKELDGLPIVIRLLDLPLHEFLPAEQDITDPVVKARIADLKETNPMLGHRGVRLAVTTPEIYEMQIAAIEEALSEVPASVSIMIPQVINLEEALTVRRLLKGSKLKFGVMMETVRACMRAGRLAQEVDFFSFGTNDLTQAVYSFSREDAEKKFLSTYLRNGILKDNPFEVLDVKGVGRLMETAMFWARRMKKEIEIGVCGEQASEPRSVRYLHGTGVDYVSCSPFRIPIAKLVAAQAAIQARQNGHNLDISSAEVIPEPART